MGSYEKGAWILVVVIISSSLLNAVYFFRIIERIYLGDTGKEKVPVVVRLTRGNLAIVVLGVSLLVAGIFNVWIVNTLIRPMLPAF
jgi:multicomponent Na+:H+ antiporter subunit D